MGFVKLFSHPSSVPEKEKEKNSRSSSLDIKEKTSKYSPTFPTPSSSNEFQRFSASSIPSPRVCASSPLQRQSLQSNEFYVSMRGCEKGGSMSVFSPAHQSKVPANKLLASRSSTGFISSSGPHSHAVSSSSKSEKCVKELLVELKNARAEADSDMVPSDEWRYKYKSISDIGTVAAVTIATFLSSVNREQAEVFTRRERNTSRQTGPSSTAPNSPPHFVKTLDLRQLRFTDSDFAKLLPALMQDVSIRNVFLCHNSLSDIGVKALVAQIEDRESCSNIVSLTLSYNGFITINGVMELLLHSSDLHHLSRLVLPGSFPSASFSSVEVVSDASKSQKKTSSMIHPASAPESPVATLPPLSSRRSMQIGLFSHDLLQHQSERQSGKRYERPCNVGTPSFSVTLQKIGKVLAQNSKLCSIFFYGCRITPGDPTARKVFDGDEGDGSLFVFSQLSSASSEWNALLCCVLWWCRSLQEFGCLDMDLGSESKEEGNGIGATAFGVHTSTPSTPCVSASLGTSEVPFSGRSPTILQRKRQNSNTNDEKKKEERKSDGKMNSVTSGSFLCDSQSPYSSLNQRIPNEDWRDSIKPLQTSSHGQSKEENSPFSSSSVLEVLRAVLCSPQHSLHTVILRTSFRSHEVTLLASTIRCSSFLKKLVLRNCDLTATNYRELGNALTQNESITYLDLSFPHSSMKMKTGENTIHRKDSSGGLNSLDSQPTSARHSAQKGSEKLHTDPNGAKDLAFSRMFKKKRSSSVCSIQTSLISPTRGASRIRPLRPLLSALDNKRRLKVLKLIEVAMDVEDIEDICDGIERRGNTSLVHLSTSFSRAEALLQKLRQLLLHNQMVADPECFYSGFKSLQED